ncbi:hypothetical protein IWX46DRAFT_244995 [Phyllosticta citricarpa]|uniref:C2H2-type domain-containing protein n=3 Tax=Phyllosticta TaxID=121621 RepID=A0ABR1LRU2_9PEZI
MNLSQTRLVGEVDAKFSLGQAQKSVPLSEVARDNGLFLAAEARIDLRPGEMQAALAVVECLLAALRHAGRQDWSETALANLEHLVLVIQQRMVHALRHAWLERVHDKRRAVGASSWFSEFPGGVRPMSTTWPWTIRPALAVLWGVCWMFYPGDNGAVQTRVRASRIEPWLGWQGPTDGACADADAEEEQKQSHHQALHAQVPNASQALQQAQAQNYPPSDSSRCHYLVSADSVVNFGAHLSPHAFPLPHLAAAHLALPDASGTQLHRALTVRVPVPRITLDDCHAISSLQPAPAPSFSPSPSPVPPPRADSISAAATQDYSFDFATTSMDVFYPQPNLGMNLPHSIPGARPMSPPDSVPETAMEQPSRKRKFSDVTAQLHAAPRERASSEEHDPIYQPRGKYSHKRTQEPPKNAMGKMICNYSSECAGITFDRKCEWSKHMDKHDRPYVCRHKGCEKLQGFTYSGGLLRHEREVHKMHGGTKKALFCPHQDCKRSMGTGFTRKENLAEHIRRVHRHASGDAADSAPAVMAAHEDPSEGASPDAEADPESPFAMSSRPQRRASGKRRRASFTSSFGAGGEGGGAEDTDDLRQEIRRLRRENEEKDQRLKKLEATVEALTRGQISSAGQAPVPV